MREQVKIVGILNIVLGAIGLFAGLAIFTVFGGLAGLLAATTQNAEGMAAGSVVALVGFAVTILVVMLSVPSLLGGWGLLHFKSWSRPWMIIVSVLNLFHFPFGTAVGVYGLVVLFHEETKALFNGMAIQRDANRPVTP